MSKVNQRADDDVAGPGRQHNDKSKGKTQATFDKRAQLFYDPKDYSNLGEEEELARALELSRKEF
jgi:hypothetical protein